jgi:hypothetical protein
MDRKRVMLVLPLVQLLLQMVHRELLPQLLPRRGLYKRTRTRTRARRGTRTDRASSHQCVIDHIEGTRTTGDGDPCGFFMCLHGH